MLMEVNSFIDRSVFWYLVLIYQQILFGCDIFSIKILMNSSTTNTMLLKPISDASERTIFCYLIKLFLRSILIRKFPSIRRQTKSFFVKQSTRNLALLSTPNCIY